MYIDKLYNRNQEYKYIDIHTLPKKSPAVLEYYVG